MFTFDSQSPKLDNNQDTLVHNIGSLPGNGKACPAWQCTKCMLSALSPSAHHHRVSITYCLSTAVSNIDRHAYLLVLFVGEGTVKDGVT